MGIPHHEGVALDGVGISSTVDDLGRGQVTVLHRPRPIDQALRSFGDFLTEDLLQLGIAAQIHGVPLGALGSTRGLSALMHRLLRGSAYSHSMVAGGLDEMSYATRLIPETSLITRDEIRSRRS